MLNTLIRMLLWPPCLVQQPYTFVNMGIWWHRHREIWIRINQKQLEWVKMNEKEYNVSKMNQNASTSMKITQKKIKVKRNSQNQFTNQNEAKVGEWIGGWVSEKSERESGWVSESVSERVGGWMGRWVDGCVSVWASRSTVRSYGLDLCAAFGRTQT